MRPLTEHLFFVFFCATVLAKKDTWFEYLEGHKSKGLGPVDAMEIYRSRENINILVPKRRSSTAFNRRHKQLTSQWQKKSPLDYMHGASRRTQDDTDMNATVSKFFPKRKSRPESPSSLLDTAATRVTADAEGEEDSLEMMEFDPPGGASSAFRSSNILQHPPTPQDFQTCGFTPVHHAEYPGSHFRVVGGRKAKPESWPWMAGLGYVRGGSVLLEFHCGGTLVTASHVLTAAHCVLRPALTLKAVRLGVLQLTDRVSALDVLVKRVVAHNKFDWVTAANDIAVVFLEDEVKFTPTIHPICLPHGRMTHANFENTFPFITGWGLTEDNKPSAWLKEVRMPVVPTEKCRQVYSNLPPGRAIPITDGQLCCGFKEGGRDACQGDSGGPLMLPAGSHPRGDVYFLIGVVSLGEGCAQPGVPGVFTRITFYLDWLAQTMGTLRSSTQFRYDEGTETENKD